MLSQSSWPTCPEPRWATPRNPKRKTLGPRLAAIAAKFGQPFMPWQAWVANVALEIREDGLPAYRETVITVPRQNGKTTLILAWELDRALMWGVRQRIIYSAQTGGDARQKLLEDQVPIIHGDPEGTGPFSPAIRKIDKTNGREAILFRGGSRLGVVASSESSGHGKTIGLGVVDEAFNDVDDRREGALLPAMLTVRDAQLVVASTMGTDASLYLNRKVDTGRSLVGTPDSEVAYFEWSAPEGVDIDNPEVWAACMPAYGITVTERAVRHARATMTEGEFRRAMLNQRTASDERIIPLDLWQAVCSPDVQPDGRVVFAVDCNPERNSASISVADDRGRVELLEHERGLGWVVPRAKQLQDRWSAPVAVNKAGPAGALVDELERFQVRTVDVSGQEFVHACGHFYDRVVEAKCEIRTDQRLDLAMAAAKRRPVGDAWVWGRKTSSMDISPVVTATLALWCAQQARGPAKYFSAEELWA